MDEKAMTPNPRLEIFYRRMLFNNLARLKNTNFIENQSNLYNNF